jgi:hypothetical protein
VSYSRADQSFAFSLAAALKNGGVAIWIDQFEIVVGQDWRAELEKNLNTSSGCIVIISPDYVDSEYCRKRTPSRKRAENPYSPRTPPHGRAGHSPFRVCSTFCFHHRT